MRGQRTPAHRSAAFLAADENVLPILGERIPAEVLGVRKVDQYVPLFAVGAECPDQASTSAPFATPWARRTTVYWSPLLVEETQLGIGQPTRLADARRGILLLHSRFYCERKGSFMIPTRIAMIEGVHDRPHLREFRHALASEKLIELHPPLSGLLR